MVRRKVVRETKLHRCFMDIMRRLFKESDPSADFDRLRESGEAKELEFFMRYFLEQEKMDTIFDEEVREARLTKREIRIMRTLVYSGCSPNSCRKTWKDARKRK